MAHSSNRRDGTPSAATDPRSGPIGRADADAAANALAVEMGSFVAWLATQDIDEPTRRAHREAVEAFLRWRDEDQGPRATRRHRWEQVLAAAGAEQAAAARAGLRRFADYRAVVAITLPPNH